VTRPVGEPDRGLEPPSHARHRAPCTRQGQGRGFDRAGRGDPRSGGRSPLWGGPPAGGKARARCTTATCRHSRRHYGTTSRADRGAVQPPPLAAPSSRSSATGPQSSSSPSPGSPWPSWASSGPAPTRPRSSSRGRAGGSRARREALEPSCRACAERAAPSPPAPSRERRGARPRTRAGRTRGPWHRSPSRG